MMNIDLLLSIIGALVIYVLFRFLAGYFSYYQLATGLPEDIGFWSIIKRLSLPFIVAFLFGIILQWFNVHYSNNLKFGVGLLFVLFIIVPIIFNKELLPEEIIENNQIKEVYVIYFALLLSSTLLSFFGFSLAEFFAERYIYRTIMPSSKGLVDGLWATGIWFVSSIIINRIKEKIKSS